MNDRVFFVNRQAKWDSQEHIRAACRFSVQTVITWLSRRQPTWAYRLTERWTRARRPRRPVSTGHHPHTDHPHIPHTGNDFLQQQPPQVSHAASPSLKTKEKKLREQTLTRPLDHIFPRRITRIICRFPYTRFENFLFIHVSTRWTESKRKRIQISSCFLSEFSLVYLQSRLISLQLFSQFFPVQMIKQTRETWRGRNLNGTIIFDKPIDIESLLQQCVSRWSYFYSFLITIIFGVNITRCNVRFVIFLDTHSTRGLRYLDLAVNGWWWLRWRLQLDFKSPIDLWLTTIPVGYVTRECLPPPDRTCEEQWKKKKRWKGWSKFPLQSIL